MSDVKSFRQWVRDKWYEHVDELEAWRLPVNYDSEHYFQRYRWWLKREYQYYRKSVV